MSPKPVAKPGDGRTPPPPLFLDQTETRRAEKKIKLETPAPTPPPLASSEGLDPLLQALYQKLQRTKN